MITVFRTLVMTAALLVSLGMGAATAAPQGDVVVAMPVLNQRFDPIEMVSLTDTLNFNLLFDSLLAPTTEGKGPGLATEWKVSADGLAFEFTLRRGVKFHNGDPFTADDVKFTFEKIVSAGNTHAYRKGFEDALARVEVLAPQRVRFVLKKPFPAFFTASRYGLQPIVPKKYYEHVGGKAFQQKPVGTGPFKLVELKAGEWTKFEANTEYWGPHADMATVTQRLAAEPLTRVAMLARGEADLITGVTGPLVKEIRSQAGARIIASPYAGTSFLTFNRNTNPEFKDRRVRQAVAHAIDRDGIAQTILEGVCDVSGQHFTPGTFGFDGAIKSLPYDPARAKALLAEAGVKPGYETAFIVHTQSFGSLPEAPKVLEAIAGQLEAVGFKLVRRPMETGAILAAQRGHTLPGISYGPSSSPDDGGALLDAWFVSTATFGNQSLKDPAYDLAFKRQAAEGNLEKRRAILQEWARLEAERLEAVPLFWCSAPFAVSKRVKEWKPPIGGGYFLNLHHMKLAR